MFSTQKSKKEGGRRATQIHSDAPSTTAQSNNSQSSNASQSRSSGSFGSISLPKGGGAIASMGEKFDVSPATGTATLTIPISVSPGRGGIEPNISLTYDSGNGNGLFGLGWSLSLPSINRKSDKGIPRYRDSEDSDVFTLSAEDLVPIFKRNEGGGIVIDKTTGNPVVHEEFRDGYVIRKYSPRVESSFLRIERWTKSDAPGTTHWRTITSDNVTSIYGVNDNSRIYNPTIEKDEQSTFSWLISETYDTRGNALIYKYKSENSEGVCRDRPQERNRNDQTRSSNRYIKAIKYGNKTPNRDPGSWEAFSAFSLPDDGWMFTLTFDYGDHNLECPQVDDVGSWFARSDPFSSYRSSFEIRTYRLCRRILMFHHFANKLGINDYLVQSTDFKYDENPANTYLTSVTRSGYLRGDGEFCYIQKSLPPLEFKYSRFPSDNELSNLKLEDIDSNSLENLPYGVDGSTYRWLDLNGEGLSGVLTQQGNGWFYKRNLSTNNKIDEVEMTTIPKLAPLQHVYSAPSLNSSTTFFSDIQGDGLMELVTLDNSVRGFYSREFVMGAASGWTPFRQFKSFPNINSRDPELRFIDLTGDGLPDILVSEDQAFLWYPSLGVEGYGEGTRTAQSFDEEKGPRFVFSDPENAIYLADMSGDGLTDLLRVRNGQVCYWPNTGYGSFGAKITMNNSPWFAALLEFDQRSIQIADIDGSGTCPDYTY
jgi:Salmonella virulence plasmid 65kDa B protein